MPNSCAYFEWVWYWYCFLLGDLWTADRSTHKKH